MTRPSDAASLREALTHISFLRSCIASGEHLSAADLAMLDDFQRRTLAALAAAPVASGDVCAGCGVEGNFSDEMGTKSCRSCGTTYRAPVASADEAWYLSTCPTCQGTGRADTPALDVKLLAVAIDEVGLVTWDADPREMRHKTATEIAVDAAPRYARLRSADAPEGGGT